MELENSRPHLVSQIRHFVSRPSLRLMVRTYIRKAMPQGWPWRRPQQGWPACRLLAGEEWSRRSSRSKGCSKSERIARGRGSKKAAATNRWKQWAKHSDERQSTSNQLQTV
jgi:hypothetical protein